MGGHGHAEAPKIDFSKVYRPPVAPKTLPKVGWALYNYVFKRNSTFIGAIVVVAVIGEAIVNSGVDTVWDRINRGKQWKDIKDNYGK